MVEKKTHADEATRLRQQAEELERKNALQPPQDPESLSSADIQKTLHELRVHQIELEMQNEELRRTQVELEATRERYFDLYNLAPVGYVTLSEQGLILETNLTAAGMLGVPRGALIHQLFTRFILKEDHDSYYLDRKQLLLQSPHVETGMPQTLELRMLKYEARSTYRPGFVTGNEKELHSGAEMDATPFWAHLTVTAVEDSDGVPGKTFRVVLSDITGRKQAEEAMRKSEKHFRSVIQTATDAIISTESSGTIISWNKGAQHVFQYAEEEILGQPLSVLMPQRYRDLHLAGMQRIEAGGESHIIGQVIEIAGLRKDGVEIPIELALSFWQSGQKMFFTGIIRDITERKQLEAELLQEKSLLAQKVEERTADLHLANTELQRAARVKDEFLASMSHELRTPLTGILGLSEVLQRGFYGNLNPKQVESIQNIEKSGHHLLTLINDILDLSKIGAGMIELELNTVSIRNVCQASMHMIRQAADEKQIKVDLAIEEGVNYLEADERRLKQILVNLLSNAVKFSPSGSDIGLEVKGDAGNQHITFTIWDHGIGIPLQDLSRLFQVFIQLDSALSRQYGGTGLGLSLVLKMVELHGGGVRVESEPGKGSRFIVTLPWQGNPAPEADKVPPQTIGEVEVRKSIVNPTLLIVEDNLLYLNLLTDMLTHSGYRVIKAQNGEEGIARAHELKPDLILMDIQMPVLDGFQATRQIRMDPNLEKTPIIALTALAMSGDREKCIEAGMNGYLSKPVNIEDLKKTIDSLIYHGTEMKGNGK